MLRLRRVLLAALLLPLTTAVAHAGSAPPPPPPTPACTWCKGGPPPPPTPVATLLPTPAPARSLVVIHLSARKMKRGHALKLTVMSDSAARVTMVVRYSRGKPVIYHGKVSDSGTYTKAWTIPRSAPLGKAQVTVTVAGGNDPFVHTLTFTVTK